MSLSAINHKRLDRLNELTHNYNKASLLDKFIFWWQHSTYTLNDNQKWFTRSIERISKDSGIAKRSVERYMSQFEKLGLIEKRCILLRKKNLYIRITDKLLAFLGKAPQKEDEKSNQEEEPKQTESLNLTHNGGSNDVQLASFYNKSKEPIVKNNSTVSQNGIVNNSDELIKTTKPKEQINESSNCEYKIEKEIGERITTRFKNYIKGVLTNLQEQYNLKISNPDKLFAEVVFSVTNKESQFPGIDNAHHRMNIIAKLLRKGRWKTPKGFYNHWDVGQVFRERDEVKQRQHEAQKQEEGVDASSIAKEKTTYFKPEQPKTATYKQLQVKKQLKAQQHELKQEIMTQQKYLTQLEEWFEQGRVGVSQQTIDSCAISIAKLYEELETKQAI